MVADATPLNGKQRGTAEPAEPTVDGYVIACPDRPVATPDEVETARNSDLVTIGPVDSRPGHMTAGSCGEKPVRGWVIGPPSIPITAAEHEIRYYDNDWPDPECTEPMPPEPTCPPWKFGAQRDKRHSHRRTNKRGRRR